MFNNKKTDTGNTLYRDRHLAMANPLAQATELRHLSPEPKYIALEDLNFAFLEAEILLVIADWKAKVPIWDTAATLKRPQEERFLLQLDLSLKGAIRLRRGGVYGRIERRQGENE